MHARINSENEEKVIKAEEVVFDSTISLIVVFRASSAFKKGVNVVISIDPVVSCSSGIIYLKYKKIIISQKINEK